jgi:hypothetical protein
MVLNQDLNEIPIQEDPMEMLIHSMEEPQWNLPDAVEEIHLPHF